MKKSLRRNCKRKCIHHFDYAKKKVKIALTRIIQSLYSDSYVRPLETIIHLFLLHLPKTFNIMKIIFRRWPGMTFFFFI